MPSFFRYTLIGLGLVVAQWLVLGRLRLWGAYPDAVLLFVAWLALRKGRRAGASAGFTYGLLLDAIYGTWGVHAFVKTVSGFVVGLFPANERETLLILPSQALIGGFVIALLHQGLFVLLLALQSGSRNLVSVLALWLGVALYTALLGFAAALFGRH